MDTKQQTTFSLQRTQEFQKLTVVLLQIMTATHVIKLQKDKLIMAILKQTTCNYYKFIIYL